MIFKKHLPDVEFDPLDVVLPTAEGWVNINDVTVGDYVLNEKGKRALVIGTKRNGIQDVMRMKFDDNRVLVAYSDQLWQVRISTISTLKFAVLTTKTIMEIMDEYDIYVSALKNHWNVGDNSFIGKIKEESDLLRVTKVETVGQAESKFIMVENMEKVYLTGPFVVTHNEHCPDKEFMNSRMKEFTK